MEEKEFYLYIEGKPVRVSREVYREYYRGERKERYFMQDLKRGRTVVDPEKQTVMFVPGREDSYGRLLEAGGEFALPGESLEEQALMSLASEERDVVRELYCLGKTEREACAALHMAKTTLHRRRNQALDKLRKLLEENL